MFCESCGAILPPDGPADHFRVLDVAPAFAVDLDTLERRYKDAARKVHPDKFARADVRARRAALGHSVRLNDAWKTLRDPVKRAEYLLSQAGIEVGGEEGTTRRADALAGPAGTGDAAAAPGERVRVPVPQELLMDILELREALLDARAEGDEATAKRLAVGVADRRAKAMDAVADALAAAPADLDRASRELVAVRYFDRFLTEADAQGSTMAAAVGEGVGHGG